MKAIKMVWDRQSDVLHVAFTLFKSPWHFLVKLFLQKRTKRNYLSTYCKWWINEQRNVKCEKMLERSDKVLELLSTFKEKLHISKIIEFLVILS